MKILFLDDNPERTKHFCDEITKILDIQPECCETAMECIEKLKSSDWDYVFLDHDLGGEIFVDSGREDCGMEVVRWIEINQPIIKNIIVHSHNTPAARVMESSLRNVGYDVRYVPFSTMTIG